MTKKRERKVHRMSFTDQNVKLLAMGLKTQTRRVKDKGYRRGDIILVNERHIIRHRPSGVVILYEQSIFGIRDPVTYTETQLPVSYKKKPYRGMVCRPPMFMPNFAVRFVLKVEGVRHQRIKRMTWRDVEAEGVVLKTSLRGKMRDAHARERFAAEIWDPINPDNLFDSNPMVTAVRFRLFPYLGNNGTSDDAERDEVFSKIFGRDGHWTSKGFRA